MANNNGLLIPLIIKPIKVQKATIKYVNSKEASVLCAFEFPFAEILGLQEKA